MRLTKREYLPGVTDAIRHELNLISGELSVPAYRTAMTQLGKYLGQSIKLPRSGAPFALVATPEDADFLVAGMLKELPTDRARLVCYWTSRKHFDDGDLATVVQQYVDPRLSSTVDTVVIAKAIIASGCIVRAHLEKFLTKFNPRRIVIAAPVMVRDADKSLMSSFGGALSKKFEFVTFATDPAADSSGIVRPGVGGNVEERLGLENEPQRFAPNLITTWREDKPSTVAP